MNRNPSPIPLTQSTIRARNVCHVSVRAGLVPMAVLMLAFAGSAADWYVSPGASSSGNGSLSSPWQLQAALNHPSAVKPGDTIWLRGGTYAGAFTSRLQGSQGNWITMRQYAGERAVLDGKGATRATLAILSPWARFWGFEITNSDTDRPADIQWYRMAGISIEAPNVQLINLIVHDAGQGIGAQDPDGGTECETYGCVVFFNGCDNNLDHGLYYQNLTGGKRILDNIVYANAQTGIHIYGSDAGLDNFTVAGNIIYDNGVIGTHGTRNVLMGGSDLAQSDTFKNNILYFSTGSGPHLDLGMYSGGAGTENATVTGNYIAGNSSSNPVRFRSPYSGLVLKDNTFDASIVGITPSSFPQNTYLSSKPSGARVFVRPNAYEPGRANLAIYNWSLQSSVAVDISNVDKNGDGTGDGPLLQVNQQFELRNVQDYFGDVITGTYTGSPIQVAMTGRSVGRPVGMSAPPSTFPQFGAFVLLPGPAGAPVNTPPTISDVPDTTIAANDSTGPLSFTVGDAQTSAGGLTVTRASSNTSLVPAANIVLGGSGANRTVTVTPASNQSGSATITLTVSDGSLTASSSFVLTVTTPNTAPTISDVADTSIAENSPTGPLSFTVGDAQTSAGGLTVTRASSNTSLVPAANIVLGGSGANRTVTVTPASNQSGSATITLTVSDGSLTASSSFVLTVTCQTQRRPSPTLRIPPSPRTPRPARCPSLWVTPRPPPAASPSPAHPPTPRWCLLPTSCSEAVAPTAPSR